MKTRFPGAVDILEGAWGSGHRCLAGYPDVKKTEHLLQPNFSLWVLFSKTVKRVQLRTKSSRSTVHFWSNSSLAGGYFASWYYLWHLPWWEREEGVCQKQRTQIHNYTKTNTQLHKDNYTITQLHITQTIVQTPPNTALELGYCFQHLRWWEREEGKCQEALGNESPQATETLHQASETLQIKGIPRKRSRETHEHTCQGEILKQ